MPFAYRRSFAALSGVLVVGAVISTVADRNTTIAKSRELLDSASVILLEHAERAIEDGDKLIRAMRAPLMAWDRVDAREGERLYVLMKSYMPGSPQISSAWASGPDGATLLDSHAYPPQPVNAKLRRYFQAHAAGVPEPFLGPTERGVVTGRERFTISRAMRGPDDAFEGVIVVAMYSDFFAELYRKVVRWSDTTAALTIRGPSGLELLAHMRDDGPPAGLLEALGRLVAKAPSGGEVVTLPGGDRLITWQSSTSHFGLVVHTSQSIDSVLAEWRARAWAAALLVFILSLLLAGVLYGLARGEQARRAMQLQRLLTSEVHHRVKNNLAIISALIRVGQRSVASGRDQGDQLAHIASQIEALAELHGQLQIVPQGASINLTGLLAPMTKSVGVATGREVRFTADASTPIADTAALHVMIVVNELITNAIKHGRDPIEVRCEHSGNDIAITITNEPAEPSLPKPESGFGMSMVKTLVASINGTLEVISTDPMVVMLTVPCRQES